MILKIFEKTYEISFTKKFPFVKTQTVIISVKPPPTIYPIYAPLNYYTPGIEPIYQTNYKRRVKI